MKRNLLSGLVGLGVVFCLTAGVAFADEAGTEVLCEYIPCVAASVDDDRIVEPEPFGPLPWEPWIE